MLRLEINRQEAFNEATGEFLLLDGTGIQIELEHSLVSLSKWESEFQQPFLTDGKKSSFEIYSYILAMIRTPDITMSALEGLTQEDVDKIQEYIDSKQSATTFGTMPERKGVGETITSELIYYWMIAFNIPFDCETWHLNRLFALIRICNIKNSKPKKMSKHEVAERNRTLNAQRKAELGTSG